MAEFDFTGTVLVPTPVVPQAAANKAYVDAAIGTNFSNPMNSVGDIIVGGTAGALTRMGQGGNGTFLGVSGGVLGYYTPGSGVTWPLTNSGDECLQPDGIANSALCVHNNASAVNGVRVIGTAAGTKAIIDGNGAGLTIGATVGEAVDIQAGTAFLATLGAGTSSVQVSNSTVTTGTAGGNNTINDGTGGISCNSLSVSGNLNATSSVRFGGAYLIALGGGAAPTVGTIGGSGPATAAQNSWLSVAIGGVTSFLPVWR